MMATEAVMKIEEAKELGCGQFDTTTCETSLEKLQKVEGGRSPPPETIDYSTKAEYSEVATDVKNDIVNPVIEGKLGISEGGSFLESPSLAKIAMEETRRASDNCEDKENLILIKKEKSENEIHLQKDQTNEDVEVTHDTTETDNVDAFGKQVSTDMSLKIARTEDEELAKSSELPSQEKNVEEYMGEKLPSLAITSASIDLNLQERKIEGGEGKVVEENKQKNEELSDNKQAPIEENLQKDRIVHDQLVENSEAVSHEQMLEANDTDDTRENGIQKEEVETFTDLASMEQNLKPVNSGEKIESMEVESPNKKADDLSITCSLAEETVKVGKKHEFSNVEPEEEIHEENGAPPEEEEHIVEVFEVSKITDTAILDQEKTRDETATSGLIQTSETECVKLEKSDELDSKEKLEDIDAMENREVMTNEEQTSDTDLRNKDTEYESIEKRIIEEDDAIKDHITVSLGDETVGQNSREDEKEQNNIEEPAPELKDEDQIYRTNDADDSPTIGILNEKVFEGLETTAAGEDTRKKITEDGIVTYLSTTSIGEETIKKSSQEYEVCEELETAGAGEDAQKHSIEEDGTVRDLSTVSVGEETTKESSQENEKEAKKQEGEVKESDSISMELNLEATDCTEKTESPTVKDDEDPNKNPNAFSITEASVEEMIQKESSDTLADTYSLVFEVSEEGSKEVILEKAENNNNKLEAESATTVTEKTCLHEAEPEGEKLVDTCDLDSEEASPETIEATETSLQGLDVKGVKLEETSNLDENANKEILAAEKPEADEAGQELKYEMPVGASVTVQESENQAIETTTETEITASNTPSDEKSEEKLQEFSMLATKGLELESTKANEKIQDETPMKEETQDESLETPLVTQRKEVISKQKEEPMKLEASEMDSEDENPNEELKKEEGERIEKPAELDAEKHNSEEKDADAILEETGLQKTEPETSGKPEYGSSLALEEKSLDTDDSSKKVNDANTMEDEIQNKNKIDITEKDDRDEEISDQITQKDKSEMETLERSMGVVSEGIKIAASSANAETDTREKEGPVKNLEKSFEEERKGGKPNDTDDSRDNGVQKEENLKTVDQGEKIESTKVESPNKNADNLSITSPLVEETVQGVGKKQEEFSNVEPEDHIHEENGVPQEEEKHIVEAFKVSKSTETPTLEQEKTTNGAATTGLIQTSEMECAKLEKTSELDSEKKLEDIDARENREEETTNKEETPDTDLNKNETEDDAGEGIENRIIEEDGAIEDYNIVPLGDETAGQSFQEDEKEQNNIEEPAPELKSEDQIYNTNDADDNTIIGIQNEKVSEGPRIADAGEDTEKQINVEDCTAKDLSTASNGEETVKESSRESKKEAEKPEGEVFEGLETASADEYIEKQIIKEDDTVKDHSTVSIEEKTVKERSHEDEQVAEKYEAELSKSLELVGASKDNNEQIIEETDAVTDHSTVSTGEEIAKQSSQEDEKEEKKLEKEVCEGLETTSEGGNIEKQIVEDDGAVKDHCIVSAGKETTKESSQEDEKEAEKPEGEVFEGPKTDGRGEDTGKEIIEKVGVVTDLSKASIGEAINESSQEDEVHERLQVASEGEAHKKHIIEDEVVVTVSEEEEEETVKESRQEDEVCEGLETTDVCEDAEKQIIEDGSITNFSTVSIIEETTKENSREDEEEKKPEKEVCEGVETTSEGGNIEKQIEEDDRAVKDHCIVSVGKETAKESSQEDEKEAKQPEGEVFEGPETAGGGEVTGKQIIENVGIVTDLSKASIGETVKESSQEDEVQERLQVASEGEADKKQIIEEDVVVTVSKEEEETVKESTQEDEVCEGLETTDVCEDAEKQIKEDGVVTEFSTVSVIEETTKENSQEDEEEKKPEKEVCEGLETTSEGGNIEKQIIEDDGAVKDHCIVSVGKEIAKESSQEDEKEAKKPEGEVFEGPKIASGGGGEDTGKQIIEKVVIVTDLSKASIGEAVKENSQEDEVHERLQVASGGEADKKHIIEEDVVVTDLSTVSKEEETVKESHQEDEVCEGLETIDVGEDAEKHIIEEDGAITDFSTVSIGEETAKGNSQEDEKKPEKEVCEGLETISEGGDIEKQIVEDNDLVKDYSIVSTGKESAKESSQEDEKEAKKPEGEVFEGLETTGGGKDTGKKITEKVHERLEVVGEGEAAKKQIIEEDVSITDLSTVSVGEDTIKESPQEDEVCEGLEIADVGEDVEKQIIEDEAVTDFSTVSVGEETKENSQEDEKEEKKLEKDVCVGLETTSEGVDMEKQIIEDDGVVKDHCIVSIGKETTKESSQEDEKEEKMFKGEVFGGLETAGRGEDTGKHITEKVGVITDFSKAFIGEAVKESSQEDEVHERLQVASEGDDDKKQIIEEDVAVTDLVTVSVGEETVKESPQEDEVCEEIETTDVGEVAEKQVIEEEGAITDFSIISVREETTKENSQEDENEEKKTEKEVCEEIETAEVGENVENQIMEEDGAIIDFSIVSIGEETTKEKSQEDDEAAKKHIIEEDVAVTDLSTVTVGEETFNESPQEDEVCEEIEIADVGENAKNQIIEEDGAITDFSTVSIGEETTKEKAQEDDEAAKKQITEEDVAVTNLSTVIVGEETVNESPREDEVCEEIETTDVGEVAEKQVIEEDGAITDFSIVSVGEETTKENSQEDEKEEKKTEEEVCEEIETTDVGEVAEKQVIEEDGAITDFSIVSVGEETTKVNSQEDEKEEKKTENEVCEEIETADVGENVENKIIEEDGAIIDFSTVSIGEETTKEKSQEDHEAAKKQIIEEDVAVTDLSIVTVGEETVNESPQEDEVCEEIEIAEVGENAKNQIIEEDGAITDFSTVSIGEETTKEKAQKDDEAAKKHIIEEDVAVTNLSTVIVGEQTVNESPQEDEVCEETETTDVGEVAEKQVIEEDGAITDFSIVSIGEETTKENSQEDEKEEKNTEKEVCEEIETADVGENVENQIIEEDGAIIDFSTVSIGEETTKEKSQEDDEAAKKHIIEEEDAVTDLSTVTVGEETVHESPQEDEVCEEIEIADVGENAKNQIIEEDGAITYFSTVSIGEKTTKEKAQEDDEAAKKQITEENVAVTSLSTVIVGEETVYESPQEDEVCEEIETTDVGEVAEKQVIEEDGAITDFSIVSIGEETTKENSQEDEKEEKKTEKEVCEEIETADVGENVENQIIEEDGAIIDFSTVSIGEETTKEKSQEDEAAKMHIIEEDVAVTDLSTVIVGEETVNESPQEDEVCEEIEIADVGENAKNQIIEEDGATTNFSTVSIGEETTKEKAQEDDEAAKKQIIEKDVAVTNLSTIIVGEETVNESPREDEVCEEIETADVGENAKNQIIAEDGAITNLSTVSIREETTKEKAQEDDEAAKKQIIEEDVAVTDLSTVTVGEETLNESPQEDEVCKEIETADVDGNAENQIIEDDGAITDFSTVSIGEETTKEKSQEDEKEEKKPEKEVCVELETTNEGGDIEKQIVEDDGTVKDHCVISAAKKPEGEVFEGLETADEGKDTGKQIIEKVHEILELAGESEAAKKQIIEEDVAFTDLSIVSKGEETVRETPHEDEVHVGLETANAGEDAIKQIIEGGGAVTDFSTVSIEEETSKENSRGDEKDANKHGGEVKESHLVSTESNVEVTDSSETLKDDEDPNKNPNAFSTTEASVEEIIQKESSGTLADAYCLVSEEQIKNEILEKAENNNNKLEAASVTTETEKASLNEAEPESEKLVNTSDLASEETSPETIEASGTSLQILDVKGVKLEETFNLDENINKEIPAAKKPDADETEQETKYEMTVGASITVPEYENQAIETTETEITASKTHLDDKSEEKLQESSTLASKEQDLQSIEANKKIQDETPMEDETQDKSLETPLVTQRIEVMSMQKEEPMKFIEASEMDSRKGNPNEEPQKKEGERLDKPAELATEKHISQAEDAHAILEREKTTELAEYIGNSKTKTSGPGLEKDKPQGEKQFNELPKELETTSACANTEKNILEQEGPVKNLEESFEESGRGCEKVEDTDFELEVEDHSQEANEASNTIKNGTLVENLKAVDPGEKLKSASEAVTEDQSLETLSETEKTKIEEDGKTIKEKDTVSVEDQMVGQSFQEEEMGNKNLEEAEPKLDGEDRSDKINDADETMEVVILNEKVPMGIEKDDESENIGKQITEEEGAAKDTYTMSTGDETVREERDSNLVSTERNFEAPDSDKKTGTVTLKDEEDLNKKSDASHVIEASGEEDCEKLAEVSNLVFKVSEENIKEEILEEADDTADKLDTASVTMVTEETSSWEAKPEGEKIVEASGIGSEKKSLKTVETTETNAMGDEVKSMKLEETSDLVSQLPTVEDEKRGQESLTVEKLDASEVEEEFKCEKPVIASDTVSESKDQGIEAIIESETATGWTLPADKSEEKLQETSALESKYQKHGMTIGIEKIKDDSMTEDESQDRRNPEVETAASQNVEADKSDEQGLGMTTAIKEIKDEIPMEDETQEKKNMEAPSVIEKTVETSLQKEEEYQKLEVSEMGFADIGKERPNGESKKEGENLEVALEFIPEEIGSQTKDVDSILEMEKITGPRESSEKEYLKDDKKLETFLQKKELEGKELKTSFYGVHEELETRGASVDTGKDVLEKDDHVKNPEESCKEDGKTGDINSSHDATENENPKEENAGVVNLSEKIETAEIESPNKNTDDLPIIHALVEKTLEGNEDQKCEEASNLESEKLERALESVSEVQSHEMIIETKKTETKEDGGIVEDGNVGQRFQEDKNGDEHLKQAGSKLEAKEDQREKTNETTENQIVDEEVSEGLENASASEIIEKQIKEEETAVKDPYLASVGEETVTDNHEEDEKGEKVEEPTKLGPDEQNRASEAEEVQTDKPDEANETTKNEILNEEVSEGLENAGAIKNSEKQITGEEGFVKDPYPVSVGEQTVEESHQEDEKGGEKVDEAATKLEPREQSHELEAEEDQSVKTNEASEITENEIVSEGLEHTGASENVEKLITEETEAATDPYLVSVGKETVNKIHQEGEEEGKKVEEAATKLNPEDQSHEANCRDGATENEEIKRPDLVLVERDLEITGSTDKTETVTIKDEESPNRNLDANVLAEEAPQEEVGDKLEEVSDLVPEEPIHEAITTNAKNMESTTEDTSAPKGLVEVEKLKSTSSDLASTPLDIIEDLHTENPDASFLTKASQEEIPEKRGKKTEDEGHDFIFVKQATAEVSLPKEERGEHIKDEAPVEETLKKEGEKKPNEANIQETICANEGGETPIPKQEESWIFLTVEHETARGSITAGPDELDNTSNLVLEEQDHGESDFVSKQIHGSEKMEIAKIVDADSLNEKPDDLSDIQPSGKEILEREDLVKLEETNKKPQNEKIEKTSDATAEEEAPREMDSMENTETKISTGRMDIPSMLENTTGKTLQKGEVEDQEPGEASGIESEVKGIECGGDKRMHDAGEEIINELKPSDSDKFSLSNLLQRSTKETLQMVENFAAEKTPPTKKEELEKKETPTIQVEEEKTDEEEVDEDEHKKADSGSDAPVMVEASRDVDVKPPHKKSHNILSGVGSKVKHSIAKVKKAIAGKSCHKPPSPNYESG